MLTLAALESRAQTIARENNLSLELARRYANLIGDTPELSENGRSIIVRDESEREIARTTDPASSPA